MKFHDLRLSEPIIRAVAAEGYQTPTPIQRMAIPEALAGKDVLGCAQTGTGKTGAFALPILHRLSKAASQNGQRSQNGKQARYGKRYRKGQRPSNGQGHRKPRALILCPTRELATQILESFNTYGANLPLRHAVIFGGVSQFHQVKQLRAGIDVLVATPGRLLDLIGQGYIDLGSIEVLVLDEADRMLDMGFIPDIRKIIECMPSRRQTLLFSATMPADIRRLADTILIDPVSVAVDPEASTVEAISQFLYMVNRQNKPILLTRLLCQGDMERTLIFTRTKHGADKLVKALKRSGIDAGAIHGNKTQNARTRVMKSFKSGTMSVLVATDIASRGIDVDEISHVVNYDIPHDPETYIHRIGRTARAGASGVALSFCDFDEVKDIRAIERLINRSLDVIKNDSDLVYHAPARQRKPSKPQSQSKSSSSNPGRWRGKSKGKRVQQSTRARQGRRC